MDLSQTSASPTPVHPSIFTLLMLPFGIMTGYVTITLAYLFSQEGISVEKIAALVGAILIPNILRFIWAPLGFDRYAERRSIVCRAGNYCISRGASCDERKKILVC